MTDTKILNAGDHVRSGQFGRGSVLLINGPTAVVRFAHGIEECEIALLEQVDSPLEAVLRSEWAVPAELVSRLQAEAILSVNSSWGVFSRSRIELLPHQLWVCRTVNRTWPTRWLVADDVGLGKTIEAGMILWPLLASGAVKRLLVLTPASLVEQWQYRLRTMFDIRLARYSQEADTEKSDFWGTHSYVAASLHTLRLDHAGRRERMVAADPWDLVIVDEAHHMNTDEQKGATLGYRLVKQLRDEGRIRSLVLFTGTPHRGKDYGFLSLLELLRPDLFDLRKPLSGQLSLLPQVMIRNNKANVTDLTGKKIFRNPVVSSETYEYSPEESHFYQLLTLFIMSGFAYASGLASSEGRAVTLVLIAMQKLASSSTAAIRRALKGRLARIRAGRKKVKELEELLSTYAEEHDPDSADEVSRLEELLAEQSSAVRLMQDEEPRLEELLAAADQIRVETKIATILEALETRFPDRQVLFFTEYKATQSLLMSALIRRYGKEAVVFINGDDRADDVLLPDGQNSSIPLPRETAAERFNEGKARFLISTEAGGEGIDLQEQCHSLIHVDLPWNPMRLHQRVGRLNRYGQSKIVEVLTLRNPATVESLIWDKLNQKLNRIIVALGQVMDEPEDLLRLVLGMTSPGVFEELFSQARQVPPEKLSEWFDAKTAQIGGQDVVAAVRDLVGNASRFDFHQVSEQLPRVDLPDLRPFVELAVTLNGRKVRDEDGGLSFLTPDVWKTDPAVRHEYRGLHFDRRDRSREAAVKLAGVGHKAVDAALKQAASRDATLCSVPTDVVSWPVIAFRIRDRVTGQASASRPLVAGIEFAGEGTAPVLLKDWELLRRLNSVPVRRNVMNGPSAPIAEPQLVQEAIDSAGAALVGELDRLDHGFRVPEIEVIGVVWPQSS